MSRPITIPSKTRVAIIGSGMAGLSAAWMLSQRGFRVTIFEKGSRPGLSAHSRDFSKLLPETDGELHGDVPSRMFNASLWPTVTKLYKDAGVETEAVDHRQTFHRGDEVFLKIGLPYSATDLKNVFNPVARRLIKSLKSFQNVGIDALANGSANDITFKEYLDSHFSVGSEDFLDCFLFPALTSTVFTCSKSDLLQYPCVLVLEALQRIVSDGNPLMRTTNGSHSAAQKLMGCVESIHFGATVEQVKNGGENASVYVDGRSIEFDHVVIATQANHASAIIGDSMPEESDLLKRFRYVDVPISVHTDSSILPSKQSDRGTFNFDNASRETATCTVWMNRFHPRWPKTIDVFHSIFPTDTIDPKRVLFSTVMQRPVVDVATQDLLAKLDSLHSLERRVWFAGSYAAAGVPLLESAVRSSVALVENIATTTLQNSV